MVLFYSCLERFFHGSGVHIIYSTFQGDYKQSEVICMGNFCYWCQRFIMYYMLNGHVVVKLALPTFELAKCTAVQVFGCLGSGSDGVELFVVDRVKRQRYNYFFPLSLWDRPIESEDEYL